MSNEGVSARAEFRTQGVYYFVVRVARVVPIARPHVLYRYVDVQRLKSSANYEEAFNAVANLEIGYGQGANKALKAQGIECEDFYLDVSWLQTLWAKENGVKFTQEDWIREILYKQIENFRPDVVFFQGTEPPGGTRSWQDFRSNQPNIRASVGHYGHTHDISSLDHAFLGFPCLVKSAREKGISSSLLYHAFDRTLLERFSEPRRLAYDFTFTGSVGFEINSHFARYKFLLELCRLTPLELWVDEYHSMFAPDKKLQTSELEFETKKTILDRLRVISKDPIRIYHKFMITLKKMQKAEEKELLPIERCREGVYGLQVHELVRSSLLTLQFHSTAMKGEVGAHRLFHSPGSGGCLVTDHGTNLSDLYEPDYEVVSYASLEECKEKVTFLLDNPEKAKQIASAGQSRTLKDHTHDSRAAEIVAILSSLI